MDEAKIKTVLENYREMVVNIREALRLAGLPEAMIIRETINLPDLEKLLPEDVVKFYEEVKVMTILFLNNLGFSTREISKRIGGSSKDIVSKILNDYFPKEVKSLKK